MTGAIVSTVAHGAETLLTGGEFSKAGFAGAATQGAIVGGVAGTFGPAALKAAAVQPGATAAGGAILNLGAL